MERYATWRPVAAAALSCLAGACALAPAPTSEDIRAKAMANAHVPAKWSTDANPAEVAGGWIATFDDPQLARLVDEAIAYNPDLVVAAARVEAAEAAARAAGAALYPQLNLAGRGGGKLSGDGSGLQGIGLFASWEIDLWGRVRANRAGATAQYEAAVLDARYAQASIAALVAKSWFLAREAIAQGALARDMVASADALAGLTRDRARVGKTDDLEIAQSEASVLAYRDVALQADLARQNALRAVEILAGRYPSAELDVGSGLPAPPAAVPAGLPSQLLERRPDVRAAERRVAAAFYAKEEARAARLPRIALTASVSSISSDLFVLKERDNPVWSYGGSLTAPIFNAGALKAQVDVRTAEQKAAAADYARIGSRAFAEVENALSASFNLDTRAQVLAAAVQANERALGFTRVRYDVGSADQRSVQTQLLALHTARTSLVHVQAERLIQRVNLHLALGGSFSTNALSSP
ncbi:MAG TPA: efflux transporter outer membrane subunit [Usitatibacter sp.]|jgi:NodT family efflux transporter outer membrane factor (OMF) lipoprotein|nr:efflux transporter outer membrane subunit [Usitatibacter sp.]